MNLFTDLKRAIWPDSDEEDDGRGRYDEEDSPFMERSSRHDRERDRDRERERDRERDRESTIERTRGKVVNIHATTQLKVVLVRPERFESAREIADHLKERRTVVVNLEDTHKDVARRLVDFLSGVVYAVEGKIKKVAVNTYLITPYSVDIQGDLLDELENNGLYF